MSECYHAVSKMTSVQTLEHPMGIMGSEVLSERKDCSLTTKDNNLFFASNVQSNQASQ